MHLPRFFHLMAILAGLISHVMGAMTQEQIINALDLLTTTVNAANSDASSLTAATADANTQTIINNNNGIVAQINEDIEALQGTGTLSVSEQQAVGSAFTLFSDAMVEYANTLGEEAKDFSLPIDLEAVQETVEEILQVETEFVQLAEFVGMDEITGTFSAVQAAIDGALAAIEAALTG